MPVFSVVRMLSLLLLLTCSMAGAETIHLAYADTESFPYQIGNSNRISAQPGIAVDIIQTIARQNNWTVELERLPGKRVLYSLEQGEIDGAFIFSYNAQRSVFIRYPMRDGKPDHEKRIATLSYYLYTLNDSGVTWDGEAFSQLNGPLGADLGYSIVGNLKALGYPVEETPGTLNNLKKLMAKRIPAYVGQGVVVDRYLSNMPSSQIQKSTLPIVTKDYFLVFTKPFAEQNPALVEQFWTAIGEQRESLTTTFIDRYVSDHTD